MTDQPRITARLVAGIVTAGLMTTACAGVSVPHMDSPGSHFDVVNGGVEIGPDSRVGNVSVVNGGVSLGDRTRAGQVDVVNGDVTFGRDVRVASVETINGAIEAGDGLTVADDLETVNGDIVLARGADVGGDIETVNGDMGFSHARIGGDIETVHGDLDTGPSSVIAGDIIYQRPDKERWLPPTVIIGPGTRVLGELSFGRTVRLFVHDTAEIGPVRGAEVRRFSGDRP